MVYRPKNLVVGIGCNQGVSCSQIEEAVKRVFLEQGLPIASIRNLATIELKSCEQGLLEFARVHAIPIDFFIPGVTAFCAAAALLGAPLMHDFAVISLSDRLTPWQEISRRLQMAAQGDFIIVLYNPKSTERQCQISKAREILLKYRSGSTPVGVVDSAYRDGQSITITDLEHTLDSDIDMSTTIIVGKSNTFRFGEWLITPRGYQAKYR